MYIYTYVQINAAVKLYSFATLHLVNKYGNI